MWSAYDDRRRRDIPPSSSARYYDSVYGQPPSRSSRSQYGQDAAEPSPSAAAAAARGGASSHDRHRRKSVPVTADEPAAGRPSPLRRRAKVVASDDGWGASPRDAYGYSGRQPAAAAATSSSSSSRHDAEAKTSESNRKFREKRGGYETDEAQNLRRAKSYSPRGAARQAEAPRHASPQAPPKSNWSGGAGGDEYGSGSGSGSAGSGGGLHRAATTAGGKKGGLGGRQYYEEDPYAAGRGKSRDRERGNKGGGGYDYSTSASGMPRPPMGDYPPYKSSPLSSSRAGEADEKKNAAKHRGNDTRGAREREREREREPPYYGSGYSQYEQPAPETAARRGRRHDRERGGAEDSSAGYGYGAQGGYASSAAQSQPTRGSPRGRHRQPPPDQYEDPYDRTPRPRHRQSMPPQTTRSRYGEYNESDPHGASGGGGQTQPRRRATSMNQAQYGGGGGGGGGGYDARDSRRGGYYDEQRPGGGYAGGRTNSGGSGYAAAAAAAATPSAAGNRKGKSKQFGKQAGKLFMTHAFPVIKQEAVPLLTKAAQAYFDNRR